MLTQEQLKERLHYDPETGAFTWLQCYQSRYIGKPAGTDENGYIRIKIKKQGFKAHRLAWLYMTGERPKSDIDHINGDPSDNRWFNLRAASHTENTRNAKTRSDNTSGIKGVSYSSGKKKWAAQIFHKGKNLHLGYFDDKEEAGRVVAKKRNELHQEFARHA